MCIRDRPYGKITFVLQKMKFYHMFVIESRDTESKARAGILKTPHGDIPTPIFMPVGTCGTVKGILQRDLTEDCLLYTSDAADEEDSVDLGGRRIIKKK